MQRLLSCLLGLVLALSWPASQTQPVERDGADRLLTSLVAELSRATKDLVAATVASQEIAAHEAAGAHPTPQGVRARAGWQWPLRGPQKVVKAFDPPEKRWLPGHRGVDLAGFTYAPVLAVADGTVTYSGSIAGVGIVSITHPDGIRSTYQPVTERIEEGERVASGDRVGYLGAVGSHCLLRTCLHLGAVRGKDGYLDPLLFLQSWELTLLPHD